MDPSATSSLARFVVKAGLLSADALQSVLATRDHSDDRLARDLVEQDLVSGAKLAQILSYQLCLPWVSLEHVDFSPKLLRLIPVEIAARFGVVPVHMRRRASDGRMTLYVATDDPTNEVALKACERAAKMPVRMMVATSNDITITLAEEYGHGELPSGARHEPLEDTSPEGQAIGDVAPPAPRNDGARSVPKPPPPPRAANGPEASGPPDLVARKPPPAPRISSPDLEAYRTPSAPPTARAAGASSPPPPVVTGNFGPSASSPPPPRVGLTSSPNLSIGSRPPPRVGMASSPNLDPPPFVSPVAPPVAPRILTSPADDDLEEIDEVDDEDLPQTTRLPTDPPAPVEIVPNIVETRPSRPDAPFRSSLDLSEAARSAETLTAAARGSGFGKTPSDPPALFDASSWEPPSPTENVPAVYAPPPPPPPSFKSSTQASAPPPPGAVPPPPPPPLPRADSELAPAFEDVDEDLEVNLRDSYLSDHELDESPTLPPAQPERSAPPASVDAVPTPRSTVHESVVLVVGAEEEFALKCQRIARGTSARVIRCTLMTAAMRAKEHHPFLILVPGDVYAFDHFSFNKLALETGSPLLVWEADLDPEQVAVLCAVAYRRATS